MIQNYSYINISQTHTIVVFNDASTNLCLSSGQSAQLTKLHKKLLKYSEADESMVFDTIILKNGTFRAYYYLNNKKQIFIVPLKEAQKEFNAFMKHIQKDLEDEQ